MRTLLFILPFFLVANIAAAQLNVRIQNNPSPLVFDELSDFTNGVQSDMLCYIGGPLYSRASNWEVMIRATRELRFRRYTIPLENIEVSVQNSDIGQTQKISLSTRNQFLIRLGRPVQFVPQIGFLVNFRAIGGEAFLQPPGSYTTTLILTVVED
ncbi:MAG: hypothetical protein AB8G22_06685 [Saprospiraceae bacterium]